MAKKSLEMLTESMFYALMSLWTHDRYGAEIAEYAKKRTKGVLTIGPGTLYTILAKFKEEGLIEETRVEGRKRTYVITEAGRRRYQEEAMRLQRCLQDAMNEGTI